jgi:NAD-dependent DNA ligase
MNVVLWFLIPDFLVILGMILRRKLERRREEAAAEAARREAEAARRAEQRRRDALAAAQAVKARQQAQQAAERAEARREKEARQNERQAAKLAAARELAELKERALRAEIELHALKGQNGPRQAQEAPRPASRTEPRQQAQQAAPGPFAGETVAFTGKVLNLSREQVISITARKGGKGYERIHADCTLLVIGDKPGKNQIEQAKKWGVKMIPWQDWHRAAFGFVPASLEQKAA